MDHNHPQSFVGFDPTIQGILDYLEHHLPGILSSQLPTLSSSRNFNATFRTSTSSRKSKLSVGTSTTTSPQKKEHTALRSGDGSLVPRTGDDRSRQTLHGWIDAPPSFPASRFASSPPSTSTADQPETTSAPGTETPHPSGQTTPTSAVLPQSSVGGRRLTHVRGRV